eukprot:4821286-Lingulodinium_polyedra.AAC.1
MCVSVCASKCCSGCRGSQHCQRARRNNSQAHVWTAVSLSATITSLTLHGPTSSIVVAVPVLLIAVPVAGVGLAACRAACCGCLRVVRGRLGGGPRIPWRWVANARPRRRAR